MLKHVYSSTPKEHKLNQLYPGRNGKHCSRCYASYTLLPFPPSYV